MTGWAPPIPAPAIYPTYPTGGDTTAVLSPQWQQQPPLNVSLNPLCAPCSAPNLPTCGQVPPAPSPMVCVPMATWQAMQGVVPIASSINTSPLASAPIVSSRLASSSAPVASYAPIVYSPPYQAAGGNYNTQTNTSSVSSTNIYQQMPAANIGAPSMGAPTQPPQQYPATPVPPTNVATIPTPNTLSRPVYNYPPNAVSGYPMVNPRGVAVPVGGDPFTHPIPDVLSPDKMAPWAYFNPSRLPQQPPVSAPLPAQSLAPQPQQQPIAPPQPPATPVEPPALEAPPLPAEPTPPPAAPAAANPLQGEGKTPPAAGAGNNPNLPSMGDAFPLTRELVEKWKADLDDRHPIAARRTQAANEIATFLLQHPETTLEGQPRQILERFVNNILSTSRTGSDTDSNTTVERDMVLIALKQEAFYNLPETTVQHLEHMAKHSTALHGMEQALAQEILTKHHNGDFTPTKDFLTTYEGRFPWVITTREQAKEAAPKVKGPSATGINPDEALYQAPNTVSAALTVTAPTEKKPWYKKMFSRKPKADKTPQTLEVGQATPAANTMGGQRLNITSAA